jgi:FKBP-type peptidyl-prolyl cis-trans isomerase
MSYRVLSCVAPLVAALLVSVGCKKERPAPAAPPPESSAIPAPPDVKAPPADAEKTASGLASRVLAKGTGTQHPQASDTVEVHYTGWTTDGNMFDSSVARHQSIKFPLSNVIKGWTEGVQLMVQGEKRRFWIPANLAYGDPPRPGRPAGMLVFDVELLGMKKTPPPPETPANLAAPPPSARKTGSGLTYEVLQKGTGKTHPTAKSTVELHYTGWTSDGKIVDSSVMRGQPVTIPLTSHLPTGWTEGVQLMVQGEKTRFWMPSGSVSMPGVSSNRMVFDIELLSIK